MYQYLSTWISFLAFCTYLLNDPKLAYVMSPLTLSSMILGIIITNLYLNIPLRTSIPLDLVIHIIPYLLIKSMEKEKVPFENVLLIYTIIAMMYIICFRSNILTYYKNTPWYILFLAYPFILLSCCLILQNQSPI